MKKCSAIIIDDEKEYWVNDYCFLSKKARTIRFDFKSKKEAIANFKELLGKYEGYWYLLIDRYNKTIVSGAFDPDDITFWKENL